MNSRARVRSGMLGQVRTVFLDRDGVVNEKMPEGRYVTRQEEFRLLPGVAEAIARLNRAGLRVILVSNQRGVALGLYSAADVDAIHAWLRERLAAEGARLDRVYYCPHDKGACDCRKPLPGLFKRAVVDFPELDAKTSVMIGDSLSDVEFARGLEMESIFIEGDPARRKAGAEKAAELATWTCGSLAEAAEFVLNGRSENQVSEDGERDGF